jgi:preprotein translocase subunit SecG
MWLDWIYRAGAFLAQVQAQVPVENPVRVNPAPHPASPMAPGGIAISILQIIYFVVCIALIAAVMLQTTKSEGLSGMMGGSTQSIFRGKKSFEEKVSTITTWVAGAFVIGSFLIFLAIKTFNK